MGQQYLKAGLKGNVQERRMYFEINYKPRQCIKKQRHHFANSGPYSQSYGFSSSHEWIPDNSVGKESTCDAGDPKSIPESRRFSGEGISYPLQYSYFLMAQLVKNPPAMQETWALSLGWEDPLEKGKATHSSILA